MKLGVVFLIASEIFYILAGSIGLVGVLAYIVWQAYPNIPNNWIKIVFFTHLGLLAVVVLYLLFQYTSTMLRRYSTNVFFQKIELEGWSGLQLSVCVLQVLFITGLYYQLGSMALQFPYIDGSEYSICLGLVIGILANITAMHQIERMDNGHKK
jgi:hypothetical protein